MIWLWFYFGIGFGLWAWAVLLMKRNLMLSDFFVGIITSIFWPLIIIGVVGWTARDFVRKKQ